MENKRKIMYKNKDKTMKRFKVSYGVLINLGTQRAQSY